MSTPRPPAVPARPVVPTNAPTPAGTPAVTSAHPPADRDVSPQRQTVLFAGSAEKRRGPCPGRDDCPSPVRKAARSSDGPQTTSRKVVTGSAAASVHPGNNSAVATPSSSAADASLLRAVAASADAAPRSKRVGTERYRHVTGRPRGVRSSSLPPPRRSVRVNPPQPTKKSRPPSDVNRTAVMTSALHTWSRPITFMPKGRNLTNSQFQIIVSDEEFDEWEPRFARQIRTRFRKERVLSSSRDDGLGLGLRSAVESLSLLDDAAASLKTSDAKRLSRLHWEDVLCFQEDERLFVYFKRKSPVVDERFSSVPEEVRTLQQLLGVGGDTVRLDGSDFGVLRATIDKAPLHLAAVSGTLPLHQLKKYYERKDGFVVGLEGTGQKLTFAWGELVTLAEEVMFFGPPRAASREYSKLFAHVWTIAYAKQIYAHIGRETAGDSFASYALSCAYLTCSKNIYMRESLAGHDLLSFDENESSNQFFKVMDQMCKRALHATVFRMRDQNQPLIPIACIDSLIHNIPGSNPSTPPLVEQLMPRLWANLCSVRNVEGNGKVEDKKRVLSRKREVLVQLLSLRRLRNPHQLVWWSVLWSIAFYGWGVGRTALNATNIFGTTCNSHTRDRRVKILTEGLANKRISELRSHYRLIVALDNFGRGKDLHQMRGGRSHKRISGTQEMAFLTNPYNDPQFDGLHVVLSYTDQQAKPSPVLMPAYELCTGMSDAQIFLGHSSMSRSNAPDFSGNRVDAYNKLKDKAKLH